MKKRKQKILQNIPVEIKSIIKIPVTVPPNTSILEARDILVQHRIGRLVITIDKKPLGIVTEKDLARSVSIFSEKPLKKILVKEIMSKKLVSVPVEASVHDCAKLMKKHGISSVVVVNNKDKLVGVVTKTDLVSTFLVQSTAVLKISDVMSKKVITVEPDDSIFEVQSVLFNNKIRRVIVVKNKSPVGIITYRDFIPAKTLEAQRDLPLSQEIAEIVKNSQINEFNVNRLSYLLTFSAKDIMTKFPLILGPNEFVYTAAIMMIRHDISGIPVVNKKLVGIVTKTDIVNVLAEVKPR